jgi:hypothetical protein
MDRRCAAGSRRAHRLPHGILHLGSRGLHPHSPRFFTHTAVDFDFEPDALAPPRWLEFLGQLWGDDTESIDTLQEIFGLMLTAETRYQKAFLLFGPKRSGKGTIAPVLVGLVGKPNCVSPTLASLGTNFRPAPLIHKRVAIISDARLGAKADQHAIAESILRIKPAKMTWRSTANIATHGTAASRSASSSSASAQCGHHADPSGELTTSLP